MYILIAIMLNGTINFVGEFNNKEKCEEANLIIKSSNSSNANLICLKK